MIEAVQVNDRIGEMAAFRSRLPQLILEKSQAAGRKIKQTEISKDSGVSLPTVQRWCDVGYTFESVNADTLYRLMDYFGCTFEELIERVN